MRRRQASSAWLDVESRRDQPDAAEVGDANMLPLPGESVTEGIGPGPKTGRPRLAPMGDWKGLPPDGTLNLRPGVRLPGAYMLCERECEEV